MIDKRKVIQGLQYTIEMFLFDPMTRNFKDPDDLNEADRITYDACINAIAMLKEQEIVRCKDCKHFHPEKLYMCRIHGSAFQPKDRDWYCADGERR